MGTGSLLPAPMGATNIYIYIYIYILPFLYHVFIRNIKTCNSYHEYQNSNSHIRNSTISVIIILII